MIQGPVPRFKRGQEMHTPCASVRREASQSGFEQPITIRSVRCCSHHQGAFGRRQGILEEQASHRRICHCHSSPSALRSSETSRPRQGLPPWICCCLSAPGTSDCGFSLLSSLQALRWMRCCLVLQQAAKAIQLIDSEGNMFMLKWWKAASFCSKELIQVVFQEYQIIREQYQRKHERLF